MKFESKNRDVRLVNEAPQGAIAIEGAIILTVSPHLENGTKVATRIAELLTKHWLDD